MKINIVSEDMPEIYSKRELSNRLHYYLPIRGYKPALPWKKQWLKGVELVNNNMKNTIEIYYYKIHVFTYDKYYLTLTNPEN